MGAPLLPLAIRAACCLRDRHAIKNIIYANREIFKQAAFEFRDHILAFFRLHPVEIVLGILVIHLLKYKTSIRQNILFDNPIRRIDNPVFANAILFIYIFFASSVVLGRCR